MQTLTKSRAIARLKRLLDKIGPLVNSRYDAPELKIWKGDTETALRRIFGEDSRFVVDFSKIDYIKVDRRGTSLEEDLQEGLREAAALLQSASEEIEDEWEDEAPDALVNEPDPPHVTTEEIAHSDHSAGSACVFIGHGHSPLWARLQLFIENDLNLRTINYESESRVGDSILPVLEKMLSQANFAVLILTAEDETVSGSKRARQNVIHEAGLFQGRLGFKKAILLKQEGLEEFTNVAGLQYISFAGDRIDQTFYELQRVLKRESLIE